MGFFISLLIGLLLNIVAYLIAPKPKQDKPSEVQDLDDPVAEQGKPIPVVWGSLTVKGINILWFGDKETRMVDYEGGSKK